MHSSIKKLVFLLAATSVAGSTALAQTATFDDLPAGPVPPGYTLPGLSWSNWIVIDKGSTYPAGKDACAVSDPNCAYNNYGLIAAISRAIPFDMTGGYFMGWADFSCGAPGTIETFNCPMTLTVTGYNGATVVGSSTVTLAPYATQWFAFNFSNVDNVTFDTQQYNGGAQAWYLADNLVFNQNVVPEPASMALLATGLVGLYGTARRRRGNNQV